MVGVDPEARTSGGIGNAFPANQPSVIGLLRRSCRAAGANVISGLMITFNNADAEYKSILLRPAGAWFPNRARRRDQRDSIAGLLSVFAQSPSRFARTK